MFLSTIERGSIAGAAQAKAIVPSAVSRRISDLEYRLGTALLYRLPKGVEPTEAGQALARHARNLLRMTARMEAEMSEFSDGVRGHVRIVANTSAITQFLPADLSSFKSRNPEINIALREETSERAVHDVEEGLADIALFSEVVSAGTLEVFPYRQDQLVVITPSSHPLAAKSQIAFADTLEYPHVGLQPGSSLLGHLVDMARDQQQTISFAVQVTSFDGVRRMVESGLGVAVLPLGSIPAQTELRVIPLSDQWAHRTLLIGVREARALPLVGRKLLETLMASQKAAGGF